MRIDNKAKTRESKRIKNTLIKLRDKLSETPRGENSMKEAYIEHRGAKPLKRGGRARIYHEVLNRTSRKREALRYEASATGEKLPLAV